MVLMRSSSSASYKNFPLCHSTECKTGDFYFIEWNQSECDWSQQRHWGQDQRTTGPAPVCSIMMSTKDEESALPSRRCENHGKVCESFIEGPFVRTWLQLNKWKKENRRWWPRNEASGSVAVLGVVEVNWSAQLIQPSNETLRRAQVLWSTRHKWEATR